MQNTSNTRQSVNRVLVITLILNLSVAFGKITLGFVTGALAITADGFHSVIDGASNVIGLLANRLAGQPPDEEHPYGHSRFETMGALGIGVLLLLTAWEVVSGAVGRVFGGGESLEITPLAFGVMLATLIINIGVNRYQVREGRRLNSAILIADAANTGADVFVTLSVMGSMALVALFGWVWVDTVAALIVVVLIGRAALGILRQTASVLVDTAPFSPEQLTELALEVPAVNHVIRARSRGAVGAAHIDIDVEVAAAMTTENAAALAAAIEKRMRDNLEGVLEVEVHFVPLQGKERDYALLVRASADALGLQTHNVYMNPSREGDVLELHVEVPPGQTLHEAHRQVSELEREIRAELPEVDDIITHIEPAPPVLADTNGITPDECDRITHRALALLQTHYPDIHWHHMRVHEQARGFGLTMHATLAADVSVEEAHDITAEAERLLRAAIHNLDRVTIHPEPDSDMA